VYGPATFELFARCSASLRHFNQMDFVMTAQRKHKNRQLIGTFTWLCLTYLMVCECYYLARSLCAGHYSAAGKSRAVVGMPSNKASLKGKTPLRTPRRTSCTIVVAESKEVGGASTMGDISVGGGDDAPPPDGVVSAAPAFACRSSGDLDAAVVCSARGVDGAGDAGSAGISGSAGEVRGVTEVVGAGDAVAGGGASDVDVTFVSCRSFEDDADVCGTGAAGVVGGAPVTGGADEVGVESVVHGAGGVGGVGMSSAIATVSIIVGASTISDWRPRSSSC
jgi:hypothetical protein